jgi:EmrB/QacA subfamily drug resistance transporter
VRKWHGNPWAVLITICLGFFMTLLDLTIVNIAIPNMIDSLHASLDAVLWVLNGYMLVLVVLLITAGRLGDLIGARNLFIAGLVIFTTASVLCGVSQSSAELIAARAVQGFGAAVMMPQTLTILTSVFPPERRGAAFGIWSAVAGVAAIAGPTLGGLLVTAFSWRWIFFINLPVGVVATVMALGIVPDSRFGRRHRLDLPGVLLASAALFCITYGLIEGERYDWGRVWSFVSIPLLLVAGVALLGVFLLVQRARQEHEPLLPFSLFQRRNFSLMNFVSGTMAFAMLGLFLPLTIYLQSVLGMSALRAGLTLAPMSLMSMILAPGIGRLVDRIGGKYILITGLSLFALGDLLIVLAAQTDSHWSSFLPGLLVAGVGMGLTFPPMTTVAMREVEPPMAGAASGVLNTNRQLGGVIGSAAVGALLQARLASALVTEAGRRAAVLPEQFRGQFVEGFRSAGKGGLEVGAGQTGAQLRLPASLPKGVADLVRRIATDTFTHGFVNAMRPTLLLPLGVLVLGVLSCLFIQRRKRPTPGQAPQPAWAEAGTS